MHDDLCQAEASNPYNFVKLHCWLKPSHAGEHYDRSFGVRWHAATPPQAEVPAVVRGPRFWPPRRAAVLAA